MALDATRRAKAVINPAAPNDIVTMNTLPISPLSPVGISAAELHRGAARPADEARRRLCGLHDARHGERSPGRRSATAGAEKIAFAWAGEAERGKRHYYRVQGPTFLIEYDNTQNDANHIHSVWRDFEGDFGRDLLREHLQALRALNDSHEVDRLQPVPGHVRLTAADFAGLC